MLRETAEQQGVTLTLQPCDGRLEVNGVRAGVPRGMASRAGKPMEAIRIDLSGPYKASMGGSV